MRKAMLVVGSALALAACGGSDSSRSSTLPVPNTATASGFTLSVFATAPMATMKPDSIVQFGNMVFVAYQNAGEVKDGSVPGITNAVVQYDLSGNMQKTFTIPGHVDGLLARADTNTFWAMAKRTAIPS